MGLYKQAESAGFLDRVLGWVGLLRRSAVTSDFLIGAGKGQRAASGVLVDLERAMRAAPFKQGLRLVSSALAGLPLSLYQRKENGDKKIKLSSDPRYGMVHRRPNRRMSSFVFRRTMQAQALATGNAYAEILRGDQLEPRALVPLPVGGTHPIRVLEDGNVLYSATRADRKQAELHSDNVIHISALGFDGLQGRDEISDAKDTLGVTLAAEQFAGTFYGNGATLGGILKTEQTIDEPTALQYAEAFNKNHQGAANAHAVSVMGHGLDYASVGVEPEKGQMLESRKFQVLETARILGVQPHLLFDLERATFSNIEQQSLDFVLYSLLPWLVQWEQELGRKLLTLAEQDDLFFGFNVAGLLRGDQASRYAGYAVGRQWGWLSVNDIRRLEDMDTIGAAGDQYLVPLNMDSAGDDAGESEIPRALRSVVGS